MSADSIKKQNLNSANSGQSADTRENWAQHNPTLPAGYLGYEIDTGRHKIGDGQSDWTELGYPLSGSKAITKDIFKPVTTDFCLEELQKYKGIRVVCSDAKLPDATDEEITLPAVQIGQEYTCLNSAASIRPAENLEGRVVHYAVTREEDTLRFYVDGFLGGTYTLEGTIGSDLDDIFGRLQLARNDSQESDYLFSGFHVVNGTALYTGESLTVPTGPISPHPDSVLLLNVTSEENPLEDETGNHEVIHEKVIDGEPEIVSSTPVVEIDGRSFIKLEKSVISDSRTATRETFDSGFYGSRTEFPFINSDSFEWVNYDGGPIQVILDGVTIDPSEYTISVIPNYSEYMTVVTNNPYEATTLQVIFDYYTWDYDERRVTVRYGSTPESGFVFEGDFTFEGFVVPVYTDHSINVAGALDPETQERTQNDLKLSIRADEANVLSEGPYYLAESFPYSNVPGILERYMLSVMYGDFNAMERMYVPILTRSFELVPDRILDWEQGIEDGRLEVNDNFILVYAGRLKDFENSTAYRINDRILVDFDEDERIYYTDNEEDEIYSFLYAYESFTSSESGDALSQIDSGLRRPYNNSYTDQGRALLHPWNESTNRASFKLFNLEYWSENWDPNPENFWEFEGELMRIVRASHFIIKEVGGIKTMWHAGWCRAQSFTTENSPYGDRLYVGNGNDRYALFGSTLWHKVDANAMVIPPFRTSIEDGASINMTGRLSTINGQHYYYTEIRADLLGNSYGNSENVNTPIGVKGSSDSGQSIKLYWMRDNCMWVYENT